MVMAPEKEEALRHQPALGRLPMTADQRFSVMRHLMPRRRTARTNRTWASPGVMDQGMTSQCVAYSGIKYLTSSPIVNRLNRLVWLTPTALYKECQQNDEWPGEAYDGTSVHALAGRLKAKGYITEYRWAFDIMPIIEHLLEVGPVVVGTDWFMDMFTPDRWGYVRPEGSLEGGHAYLLVGVNTVRKNPSGLGTGAFRILNSWGPGWGQSGRAWISFDSFRLLLDRAGEAMTATEVVLP